MTANNLFYICLDYCLFVMYTEFAAQENTNRLVRAYMCIDADNVQGSFFAPAVKNTALVVSVRSNVKVITNLQREFVPSLVSVKGVFELPYFYSYQNGCITSFAADFHPIGMYELTRKSGSFFKNNFVDAQAVFEKKETDELFRLLSQDISVQECSEQFESFIAEKSPIVLSEKSLLVERSDDLAKKNDYKWTVKDIARELYVSEKTLNRAFMEVLGISPKQYFSSALFQEIIRQYAIHKQAKIVDFLDSPFYDFSHINKWFKKFTQFSPQEFINCDMHSVGFVLEQKSTYQES